MRWKTSFTPTGLRSNPIVVPQRAVVARHQAEDAAAPVLEAKAGPAGPVLRVDPPCNRCPVALADREGAGAPRRRDSVDLREPVKAVETLGSSSSLFVSASPRNSRSNPF